MAAIDEPRLCHVICYDSVEGWRRVTTQIYKESIFSFNLIYL